MIKISCITNTTFKTLGHGKIPPNNPARGLVQNSIRELASYNVINQSTIPTRAQISFHKSHGADAYFHSYPDYYKKLSFKTFVPEKPEEKIKIGGQVYTLKAKPAHYIENYKLLPNYHIDFLWSKGKGTGTRSIQDVVKKSLSDIDTQGRVTLDACCIDDNTYPGGFYYKLGFRFCDERNNQACQNWLQNGGLRKYSPMVDGAMYLPKENISQCLNYGKI